jgi:molybdate transport system regulatory protein
MVGPGDSATVEAHLSADGLRFSERDATLLRTVDRTGSLHAAAEELGRSYSRAHTRLAELEDGFGSLVETQRGGSGGGGTVLTDRCRSLLLRFDRLRAAVDGVARAEETAFEGTVTDRDGDLATIDTDAGTLRAVVPTQVRAVSVAVRADAVTLHDPRDSPEPAATSARNRLQGFVTDVTSREGIAIVRVDIGTRAELAATVTRESATRLQLRPGSEVLASFKATATRAVPREPSGV